MRKRSSSRKQLLKDLEIAGRESSAVTILFHDAIAYMVGLSAIEEKTIDILARSGPLTARELAARTALAPASVTALIRRLEKKRFVVHRQNPHDARSILIAIRDGALNELGLHYRHFGELLDELYEDYSDKELELIVNFLLAVSERQREALSRLQTKHPQGRKSYSRHRDSSA